jgi:hypothetical protein
MYFYGKIIYLNISELCNILKKMCRFFDKFLAKVFSESFGLYIWL